MTDVTALKWVVLPMVIILGSLWLKTTIATLIEFLRVSSLVTSLTEGEPILEWWIQTQAFFLVLGLRHIVAILIVGSCLAVYALVKRSSRSKGSSLKLMPNVIGGN